MNENNSRYSISQQALKHLTNCFWNILVSIRKFSIFLFVKMKYLVVAALFVICVAFFDSFVAADPGKRIPFKSNIEINLWLMTEFTKISFGKQELIAMLNDHSVHQLNIDDEDDRKRYFNTIKTTSIMKKKLFRIWVKKP